MINKFTDYSLRELYIRFRRRFLQQYVLEGYSDQYPCVFTLSTGRVGTQTLAMMCSLVPSILAYHEPHPLLYSLSKVSYLYADNLDARTHIILKEAFLTARKGLLDFALACHRGYIETSPQVTFLAPAILKALPEVRFLHLVRDPREVVRSGMRRRWYAGHPADETRIVPREGSTEAVQWQSLNAFQKNLWLWTATNDWILCFLASLPEDRQLCIHSEDLFSANEVALKKLFAFIGVSTPSMKRVASILKKKYNEQKTGTSLELSDWTAEMHDDLRRIAGATAKKLGYEL